jgi:hypothetical protein
LRFFTQRDRRAADDSNEAKAKKKQEEEQARYAMLPTPNQQHDKRRKIIT